jgi:segregation and condensation protein A
VSEEHAPDPAVGGADAPAGYQVRLELFEGPFDLLLQLIARRKLDVSEVDLADITGDFLASIGLDAGGVGGVGELELDTATHFLVVAATLIELKAARLLPEEERHELDDLLAEARDVLYARLLEYRAFREAAAVLHQRFRDNQAYAARQVPLEPRYQQLVPDTRLAVDPDGLAAIAASALAPRPAPRVSTAHLSRAYLTVREAAARVLARVTEPGEATTFEAVAAGLGRPDRVVHFLALLELYKLGHVDLEQADRFGSLRVERRAGGQDLAALDRAEAAPAGAAAAAG